MNKTDLASFDNSNYNPGSAIKRGLWYVVLQLVFLNGFFPFVAPKRFLLRLFGAKVGAGVVIKPRVNIKYPWFLRIGDYSWIGEEVWIDNLAEVSIGSHVCVSQGALLLCGNHNYKSPRFELIQASIKLEDGAWVGAKSVVGPGVTVGSHAILGLGSVTSVDLEPYVIYRGNPAVRLRERTISER